MHMCTKACADKHIHEYTSVQFSFDIPSVKCSACLAWYVSANYDLQLRTSTDPAIICSAFHAAVHKYKVQRWSGTRNWRDLGRKEHLSLRTETSRVLKPLLSRPTKKPLHDNSPMFTLVCQTSL